MKVLAVDTSTPQGSICLFQSDKNEPLAHRLWSRKLIRKGESKFSHSEVIIPYVKELLEGLNWAVKEIDLLMTTVGPGSFTGVRVGMNMINALSYILEAPIITTNSLELTALSARSQNLPILVLQNAHKNQNYTAIYETSEGKLIETFAPASLGHEELSQKITKPHLCLGDGFDFYQQDFSDSLKNNLHRDPEFSDFPDALSFCLNFALFDPVQSPTLEKKSWNSNKPLYIRASEAEEKLWKGLIKNHS